MPLWLVVEKKSSLTRNSLGAWTGTIVVLELIGSVSNQFSVCTEHRVHDGVPAGLRCVIDGGDRLYNVCGTASAGPAVEAGQRLQVGMILDDRANVTSPLILVVYDLFRSQRQKLEWRTHEMGAGFWRGAEMNNVPGTIDGS